MKRTGYTDLPLHTGKAPRWLFNRMVKLSKEIIYLIVLEFGRENVLEKLSDPFWFQAFGAVLGFDWHSSGLTTTVCGAIKEGLKPVNKELGLFVAGGKGANSRKTPDEIIQYGKYVSINPQSLIYASKMSAKVDSTAVQDGYTLYQHTFVFTKDGKWSVIQQGMNDQNGYARRYHWHSDKIENFVIEPHSAICCDKKEPILNLIDKNSEKTRKTTTMLSKENPKKIITELTKIKKLTLPRHHYVDTNDIHPERLYKIFEKTYEKQPENFETLLGMQGVGPKSIRALTLISDLVYGDSPSHTDPVRYSFAHGGKDGFPYPVNNEQYDLSIDILDKLISKMKVDFSEKQKALYRLHTFYAKK